METLLWFSNTVFTAAGGTEAAVFSPVNKKAKPQSPASRTNTHSCREGSPMRRVHAGGGGQGGSPASQLLDCHSRKGQPASAWVASFQKGHFPEFIDCTYTASGVKILRSCLRKRTSLMQTHFKICLYRRTSLDIMILIKGCLCV